MRAMFAVAALFVMVGCSVSPQYLLDSRDSTTFITRSSVDDAVRGISSEWLKHTASVNVVPVQDGGTIVFVLTEPNRSCVIVAKVWNQDGKTMVKYCQNKGPFSPAWMAAPVESLR